MRKLLILAVCVAALVFSAVAEANIGYGYTYISGLGNFPNAYVAIHNNTTGANGSTMSDGSGNFQFGGLVPGQSYTLSGSTCKVHSLYNSMPFSFTDGSQSYFGPLPLQYYSYGSC